MENILFVLLTQGGIACIKSRVLQWVYPRQDLLVSDKKIDKDETLKLFLRPKRRLPTMRRSEEVWAPLPSPEDPTKVGVLLTPSEALFNICELMPERLDLPLTPLLDIGEAVGFPDYLEFGRYTESVSSLLRKAFLRQDIGYNGQGVRVAIGAESSSLDTGPWTPAFEAIRSQLEKAVIW